MESGILSEKWNRRIVSYILLYYLPVFLLQLIVILIRPLLNKGKSIVHELPPYFTRVALQTNDIAVCTYPLLNTILLGLFATVLTVYLFWLGRRILKFVINRGLQKRVYTLIFSVSSFLLLRVLLLGLSILPKSDDFQFEALAFSTFLALVCCAGVCICMLVYLPIVDCLALGNSQDLKSRRKVVDRYNETVSLIANHTHLEKNSGIRLERMSSPSKDQFLFEIMEKMGAQLGHLSN